MFINAIFKKIGEAWDGENELNTTGWGAVIAAASLFLITIPLFIFLGFLVFIADSTGEATKPAIYAGAIFVLAIIFGEWAFIDWVRVQKEKISEPAFLRKAGWIIASAIVMFYPVMAFAGRKELLSIFKGLLTVDWIPIIAVIGIAGSVIGIFSLWVWLNERYVKKRNKEIDTEKKVAEKVAEEERFQKGLIEDAQLREAAAAEQARIAKLRKRSKKRGRR